MILEGWLIGSNEIPLFYINPYIDFLIYINCSIELAKKRRFEREKKFQYKNLGFTEKELEEFWNSILLPLFVKNQKDIMLRSHYFIDES